MQFLSSIKSQAASQQIMFYFYYLVVLSTLTNRSSPKVLLSIARKIKNLRLASQFKVLASKKIV